ncbi:hypothetical protein C0Q70_16587 [Pomacea canaliculata]|uniref:Serine/threonine-protein kinase RIO1 n=1 Tax=Pomacea canaliculata TaxID=400727 RepID=A0A2T7NQ66_POMCA|nr:hypothetical protein C0Q70_16587 [Pomacea canaliculata]
MVIASVVVMQRSIMASDIVPGQFDDADEELSHSSSSESKTADDIRQTSDQEDIDEEIEDDEDDWHFDMYDQDGNLTKRVQSRGGSNQQSQSSKVSGFQPREKLLSQYSNKVDFGKLPDSATSALHSLSKKTEADRNRMKDKADRATTDSVLDPRTKMLIFRLLSKGILHEITGSISTGKEANVFRGEKHTPNGTEYFALKVYKTSILTFKKREKYVDGDYRLRRGYCGPNPRKMIRTWAEKEIRNLTRIHQSGIPCPAPVLLKDHILLMSFIGSKDGIAAPLLKNTQLSQEKACELYLEIVQDMRKLYQTCHLIHADLSEFNLLYHEGKAYMIDVSQAVEHDHPNALVFLRKDCANITEFFQRRGVATMLVKELFEFITDPTITSDNVEQYLEVAMEKALVRSHNGLTEQDKIDEEVFKNVFIPRMLTEVEHYEEDVQRKLKGEDIEAHYHTVTGLKSDLSGAQQIPQLLEEKLQLASLDVDDCCSEKGTLAENSAGEETYSSSDEEGNPETDGRKTKGAKRPKNETTEEKKERKKEVKDARKEKRQHHFDSNQRTCNMTVLSMLPNLRESINKELNSDSITHLLQSSPPNKMSLWEQLKIITMTRIMIVVYGCCLLSLLLRVQLNVVGGYLFLDSLGQKSLQTQSTEARSKQQTIPQNVQEKYLSRIGYFLKQGIFDLCAFVRHAVAKEVSGISLKELMSIDYVQGVLNAVRERVECGRMEMCQGPPTLPLVQYLLPGEKVPDIEVKTDEEEICDKLDKETRDILESPDFHLVLQESLERGFTRVMDTLADHYRLKMNAENPHIGLYEVTMPCAKLLPVLESVLDNMLCDAPNPFVQELLLLEQMKNLAANIYEAFSQEQLMSPG